MHVFVISFRIKIVTLKIIIKKENIFKDRMDEKKFYLTQELPKESWGKVGKFGWWESKAPCTLFLKKRG
jgi:hypothetical protein